MQGVFSKSDVVSRLTDFIFGLSQGQASKPQSLDTLQQEIYQIEKTLADTRPNRIIRQAQPLEPMTEQQKIMDLAG